MADRKVVLDETEVNDEGAAGVEQMRRRAERAEAELAALKGKDTRAADSDTAEKSPPSPSSKGEDPLDGQGGEAELRKDSMMAHLLDSLDAGKDIGHYGRLVFAMVSRHFLPHEEVLAWMMKDKDVDEEKATLMLRQVEGRDYNPPRRAKILEYQAQQEFPILPQPDDPDCGNLYRNLKFPDAIYKHIAHYQEEKLEAEG